jgi:hypothetical protein
MEAGNWKLRVGVVWNGDPPEPPVIPAKAGIQGDDRTFLKVCGVDSRFRGNDQVSQMTPIPENGAASFEFRFSIFEFPVSSFQFLISAFCFALAYESQD